MKRKFRIIVGMLLLAIPLCMNAQVKPVRPNQDPEKAKIEKEEKMKAEKEQREQEKREKKEAKGGFEMPKISGFVQGMYQADLNKDFQLQSNTLSMRRVRLSVDGTLVKGLTYKIQGDFTRKPMLVDAFVKYKACNAFAIQIGQFKTPFSIESPINPVNLEIFDYGESIKNLVGYSDVCGVGSLGRDLGIMATGSFFPIKGEEGIKYHVVEYAIGVFNGNGANEKDNNNRKDIAGRLYVHPGLEALTLSASYYNGKYKTAEDHGTRNRWSAGLQYDDGNFLFRAEYLSGLTGYQVAAFNDSLPVLDEQGNQVYFENFRNSTGYYAVAGYNFKLGKDKSQKFMPVLRYEHFEPGDMAPVVYGSTNWYTAGINYWPIKSLNFKLDYSLIQKVVGDRTNSHRIVALVSYKF